MKSMKVLLFLSSLVKLTMPKSCFAWVPFSEPQRATHRTIMVMNKGSQQLLLTEDEKTWEVLSSSVLFVRFSLSNIFFMSPQLGALDSPWTLSYQESTVFLALPRGKLALAYLGMYRILSATTNPTLKNRLEAGRKGIHNKARDNTRTSCSLGYKTKMETRDFLC